MNIPSMSDALKIPPSERGLCMTEWYRILEPGEQLLWTGRPDYGRRLDIRQTQGGISRVTPQELALLLQRLPPILHMS